MGRSRDCDFVLNDPNISRRHALLRKDWTGFLIDDLGSKNGVIVNGRKIKGTARLRDRDEITVGPLKLVFIDPDAELLSALKDVPGFDLDEGSDGRGPRFPAESDSGPSSVATGGDPGLPLGADLDGSAEDPGADFRGADAAAAESPGEDDLAHIDPYLLESPAGHVPTEWLIIAGAALVVVASVVLLFAMLF
jgi:predicted component of type VI protein secretion system